MEFKVPASLKVEHEALHADLVRATRAGGRSGEAARAVAELLQPHFLKEEQFALPPLAILQALAMGELTPPMERVLSLTNRLKAELPGMLREHGAIVDALAGLVRAAKQERKPELERLAERLEQHAQTEEEILYPAAILAGEFVKANLVTLRR